MENHKSPIKLNDYSVKISRLTKEDGGGWIAEIPELEACKSDGESPEEALINIQDVLEDWLEVAKEDNRPIPSPNFYKHQEFSGKFTLRLSRSLHRFLSNQAEREGVSLNQFVLSLISFNAVNNYLSIMNNTGKPRSEKIASKIVEKTTFNYIIQEPAIDSFSPQGNALFRTFYRHRASLNV